MHRQRRSIAQRLLSIIYPVRAYACAPECGWSGTLPSVSGRERRRRQVRGVLVVVTLVVAGWLLIRKYGADLTWNPVPATTEGSEE